jgi:hypothetical protein
VQPVAEYLARGVRHRNGVAHDDGIDHRIAQQRRGIAGEDGMRGGCDDAFGPALSADAGGAQRGRAGADHVVDDERRPAGKVAARASAAQTAVAAVLFDEGAVDIRIQPVRQQFAEMRGARNRAAVGGDHDEGAFAQCARKTVSLMPSRWIVRSARTGSGEEVGQQRTRHDVHRRNAEGIVEGARIVDVDRRHPARTAGFQQPCHMPRGHRIAGRAPPVLTRVAEVGYDSRHTRGTGVDGRGDEEQQAQQFFVGALLRVAVQRLDDEHILPAHAGDEAGSEFAVGEGFFVVFAKCRSEVTTYCFGEGPVAARRKKTRFRLRHCTLRRDQWNAFDCRQGTRQRN